MGLARLLLLAAALVAVLCPSSAQSQQYSSLWGRDGEAWNQGPRGRLLDHSWAGYKAGAELPPGRDKLPNTVVVTDYGAVGDGKTDNVAAFLTATHSAPCNASRQCVVYIPKGTYALNSQLRITASVILRGANQQQTRLYFPRSWAQITGNNTPKAYSFGPGLLQLVNENPVMGVMTEIEQTAMDLFRVETRTSKVQAVVTRTAPKGAHVIHVSDTSGFVPGMWVRISAYEAAPSDTHVGPQSTPLVYELYGKSATEVDTSKFLGKEAAQPLLRIVARITDVFADSILLNRRLPVAISPRYGDAKVVHYNNPGIDGKIRGAEDFSIEFPTSTYQGHFKETGYNGLYIYDAANAFIRNVLVKNADIALSFQRCHFCTMMNVVVDSDRKPWKGRYGHIGVQTVRSADTLVTNFDIRSPMVDHGTFNAVFRAGRGTDLNMDYHRSGVWGNLITNVHMGRGTRPFDSGGAPGRGPHSGGWTTIWNLRSCKPQLPMPCDKGYSAAYGCGTFSPLLNLVAAKVAGEVPDGWLVENITSTLLYPQDIYTAQVQQRFGKRVYSDTLPPRTQQASQVAAPSAAAEPAAAVPVQASRRRARPSSTAPLAAATSAALLLPIRGHPFALTPPFQPRPKRQVVVPPRLQVLPSRPKSTEAQRARGNAAAAAVSTAQAAKAVRPCMPPGKPIPKPRAPDFAAVAFASIKGGR